MTIKNLLGHKNLLILLGVYTVLLTWGSLAKLVIKPIDLQVDWGDKVVHFIAYFIFTIIWFLVLFFSNKSRNNFMSSLMQAMIICFVYGLLMEFLQQTLTDYRSSDWYDVLANTTGIVFAAFLIKIIENKLIRYKMNS